MNSQSIPNHSDGILTTTSENSGLDPHAFFEIQADPQELAPTLKPIDHLTFKTIVESSSLGSLFKYTGFDVKESFDELLVLMKNPDLHLLRHVVGNMVGILDGKSMLMIFYASKQGLANVIQLCIDLGLDLNARSNEGLQPIHYAVKRDHVEILKLLLDHGCEIESTTSDGYSVLNLAVFCGSYKCSKLLIKEGAGIEPRVLGGLRPLKLAIQLENRDVGLKIGKRLLYAGATIVSDGVGHSLVMEAVIQDSYSMTKLLCEKLFIRNEKVDLDEMLDSFDGFKLDYIFTKHRITDDSIKKSITGLKGIYPLQLAVLMGNVEIVELLISYGATVDCINSREHQQTPLCLAVGTGNIKMVKVLIAYGADVNLPFKEPSLKTSHNSSDVALEMGNEEMIEFLKECGGTPTIQPKPSHCIIS